tara:strand:+ start:1198 stop:1431 length:234 start_codon:yes stop_codon:yes gene_type:complete
MKQLNITLNETEQQILIDSMMFFFSFYNNETNGNDTSNTVDMYRVWYKKNKLKDSKATFEKILYAMPVKEVALPDLK